MSKAKQALSEAEKHLSGVSIEGNIIPLKWFKVIGTKNRYGQFKSNLLAINIMAEIVYWYRPVSIRDETTGEHAGYRSKFESDKYQFAYRHAKEKFGASKKSVKAACDLLVKLEALEREFRDILLSGKAYNNVMFVSPNIQWLKDNLGTLPTKKVTASPPKREQATSLLGGTNTETSYETSKEREKTGAVGKAASPALNRRLTDLIGEAHKYLKGEKLEWKGQAGKYGKALKTIMDIVSHETDDEAKFQRVREKCIAYVEAAKNDEFLKRHGVTPLSLLNNWNKVQVQAAAGSSVMSKETFPNYKAMSPDEIKAAFVGWKKKWTEFDLKKHIAPESFKKFVQDHGGYTYALPEILIEEVHGNRKSA